MKFIQSLWTKPLIGDKAKLDQNILHYKVSSFLLKKYFPEIKLELITDTLGLDLLGKGHYDEVKLYFNDKIIDNINPVFRTVPKLFALLKYDENIIHFDGDFFLNSKDCIDNFDFDVIVQNKEAETLFKLVYSEVPLVFAMIQEKIPTENYAYNCGVLGFKNINFKNFYLKKAISLFYKIQNNYSYIEENLRYAQAPTKAMNQMDLKMDIEHPALVHRYLCCIIEQYSLAVTASQKNVHVKEILGLEEALRFRQASFNNKKFLHPCGPAKETASFLKYLRLYLKEIEHDSNIQICNFFGENPAFASEYDIDVLLKQKASEEYIKAKIIDWLKV